VSECGILAIASNPINLSDYFFRSNPLEPAEVAFTQARDEFEKKYTTDLRKKRRLESLSATSLDDILVVVENARRHYDKDQSGSRLRRYMEQISERIHYYGNIMDVFVQHHPEYVSLAWGTMKLLFGVGSQSR
jgi:hypothetical protein